MNSLKHLFRPTKSILQKSFLKKPNHRYICKMDSEFYKGVDNIIQLTPANFDSLVLADPCPWLVEFYAPWCRHCKAFIPEYRVVAARFKGLMKVGAVNADEHRNMARRFSIAGYPTIKFFGKNKNYPYNYNGERVAEELIKVGLHRIKFNS